MFDLPRRSFLGSLIAFVAGLFCRTHRMDAKARREFRDQWRVSEGKIDLSSFPRHEAFSEYNGRLVTSIRFRGVGIVKSGQVRDGDVWLSVVPKYGDYDGITKFGMSGWHVKASECFAYHAFTDDQQKEHDGLVAERSKCMPSGGLSSDPYATLMGRPMIPTEFNPTLGDQGDILAADLGQWLENKLRSEIDHV